MTWYGALLGAAGGVDAGGSGGNDTGLIGNTLGIGAGLDARDKKKADRSEREFRKLLREEALFNYGEDKRRAERTQDLAPEMTGHLAGDYATSDMLMPTDRGQIGGAALETALGTGFGYNPTMAHDPMLQVLGGDQYAVQGLQEDAAIKTESTLRDWERGQGELADSYDTATGEMRDERDRMEATYTDRIESDREDSVDDMARNIVESWVASNDSKGANGNEDFIHRRGRASKNANGRGKTLGADEEAKRDWINEQLDAGATYADIMSDPEFQDYVSRDSNTSGMYRDWQADNG